MEEPGARRTDALALERALRLTQTLIFANSDARTVADALTQTLETICQATGWSIGQAWTPAGDPARLTLQACWYRDPQHAEPLHAESLKHELAPGEGLPGRAWAAGTPVWSLDISSERSLPRRRSVLALGLKSAMAVPVPFAERAVAVLEFFDERSRSEDRELLETVWAVATHLGSLLHAKEVEDELREREWQFRSIVETANDAVVLADANGTIGYFNGRAQRMFGRPAEEALGMPLTTLMPERLRAAHERGFHRFLETGESTAIGRTLELSALRADGSEFPMELSLTTWQVGEEPVFAAFIRDITERKEIAAQLEGTAARLQEAQEIAGLGFWEADRGAGELVWSDELYRIYGCRREDFAPTFAGLLERVHPDDRAALVARDRAMGPGRFEFEMRIVRPDGTVRTLQERGIARAGADGRVAQLVGTAYDITELKRNEQLVEELNRRNRLILDAAADGIYGLDAEGCALFVNRSAAEMLGWSAEELAGRELHTLVHHSRPDGTPYAVEECPICGLLRGGGVESVDHDVFWRKDGTAVPVEYSASPMRVDGEIRGVVVTFRDTTERIRMSSEHAVLEARVRQSERLESVGQLAGGVAHDFNNLLAVILNYAAFVKGRLPADDALRAELEEIRRAAERAADLTRQLLIFSKREPVQLEVVDLNDVIRGIDPLLRRTLGANIALDVDLAEGVPPVEIDRSQIDQVLVNLVVNARDAIDQDGQIVIETTPTEVTADGPRDSDMAPGIYAGLLVRDNGRGMPPEVAARAFDPFFTTKAKGEGTGLGLATVYGIADHAGGWVEIESAPGAGTAVSVRLPAAVGAPSPRVPQLRDPVPADGRLILVVEDEPAVRSLTARILRAHGYEVAEAADPREALAEHERRGGRVDLVLTDVVMPRGSGVELARQIRDRHPRARCLFMSGYADDQRPGTSGGAEARPLLRKPFSSEDLLIAVGDALDGASSL